MLTLNNYPAIKRLKCDLGWLALQDTRLAVLEAGQYEEFFEIAVIEPLVSSNRYHQFELSLRLSLNQFFIQPLLATNPSVNASKKADQPPLSLVTDATADLPAATETAIAEEVKLDTTLPPVELTQTISQLKAASYRFNPFRQVWHR